jgi:protein-glutamine gamma-glutamyltransferase
MKEEAKIPAARKRAAPPFLLLAVLSFWGWQEGLLLVGVGMGIVLEGARFLPLRWEVAEEDFRRIWSFCALLAFAVMVFAFTTNQMGGGIYGLSHASATEASRYVGASATLFLRWLPMTFFLFVAAQVFSENGVVPLSAISWFIRRRRKTGEGGEHYMDVTYPYFVLCLFSAAIHANEGTHEFFWGEAVLVAWALWPTRSRRIGVIGWVVAVVAAVVLGFWSQRGIGVLQAVLEGYDARWMASLLRHSVDPSRSSTALGQVGRLKMSGRILIRIEPKPGSAVPSYLREASYWHYYPQQTTWFSGGTAKDFSGMLPDATNDTSWTLVPGEDSLSVVSIDSYLEGHSKETGDPEGLLPLPSGSRRLERLPVFTLKTNLTGAVLASGPGLVMFDARFATGKTIDAPPNNTTNFDDFSVPINEVPALKKIIAEMKIPPGTSDERKKQAVRQFFASKFSYSMWLGPEKIPNTNETAVSRFLLQSRSGHCEYFATATVLLLRELGIPARYAVGFAVHESSGSGYVVRERDAHAWCLVWNEAKKTWEDYDTTPESWVATESQRASIFQWVSDVWAQVRFQIAKLRWGQSNLRTYILWGLVPLLGLLLYQIIFRRGRARKRRGKGNEVAVAVVWPGLDSEFYQLELSLAKRGVSRQTGETLSDWLKRALSDPALKGLQEPLQELLPLHYGLRFDPLGLTRVEREMLARKARVCLETLARVGEKT